MFASKSTLLSISLISLGLAQAQVSISIDGSCTGSQLSVVQGAVQDSIKIGSTAGAHMTASDPIRDAQDTQSLYQTLFVPSSDARQGISELFNKIGGMAFNGGQPGNSDITIFCGEGAQGYDSSINRFYDEHWLDANGQKVRQNIDPEPGQKSAADTTCKLNSDITAYTTNGPSRGSQTQQSHIFLCDKFFTQLSAKGLDTRSLAQIQTGLLPLGGIFNRNVARLDKIQPRGFVLFHEYFHTAPIGGTSFLSNKFPNIGDGMNYSPAGIYKIKDCNKWRVNSPQIANSYALLGLGLAIQFQDRWADFTWATGQVSSNSYKATGKGLNTSKRSAVVKRDEPHSVNRDLRRMALERMRADPNFGKAGALVRRKAEL